MPKSSTETYRCHGTRNGVHGIFQEAVEPAILGTMRQSREVLSSVDPLGLFIDQTLILPDQSIQRILVPDGGRLNGLNLL